MANRGRKSRTEDTIIIINGGSFTLTAAAMKLGVDPKVALAKVRRGLSPRQALGIREYLCWEMPDDS